MLSPVHADENDLAALIVPACAIVRDAGSVIMGFYNAAATDPSILNTEFKDDGSPVMDADKASCLLIETRLEALTPGITIVCEENKIAPKPGQLNWYIDPLDGTQEALDRTGGFCVKGSLLDENGCPVLAVVYAPVQDTLYFGYRGGQAWKQVGDAPPEIMRVRTAPPRLTALFNGKRGNALYDAARAHIQLALPVPDPVPGLPRNLQVAAGMADLHVVTGRDPTFKGGGGFIWDNAADALLLELAGGAVRTLDGGELTFTQGRGRMPSYVAFGDRALAQEAFPPKPLPGRANFA